MDRREELAEVALRFHDRAELGSLRLGRPTVPPSETSTMFTNRGLIAATRPATVTSGTRISWCASSGGCSNDWWASGISVTIARIALITMIGIPLGIWIINRLPSILKSPSGVEDARPKVGAASPIRVRRQELICPASPLSSRAMASSMRVPGVLVVAHARKKRPGADPLKRRPINMTVAWSNSRLAYAPG